MGTADWVILGYIFMVLFFMGFYWDEAGDSDWDPTQYILAVAVWPVALLFRFAIALSRVTKRFRV